MIDLEGRVVVITGGSRGIGRATALEFGRRGCRVAVAARTEQDLQEAVSDIERAGGEGMYVATDLRQKQQIRRLADAVLEQWGRIDVWINNAGLNVDYDTLAADEEWVETIFDLNLRAVYWGMRYAAEAMRHNDTDPRGVIVNISSLASEMPTFPRFSLYKSTKKAVDILSEGVALELRPQGIAVIDVLPGFTATDFSASQLGKPRGKSRPKSPDWMRIDPAIVARKIVAAVARGQTDTRVLITWYDRLAAAVAPLFESLVDWINWRRARTRSPDPPKGGSAGEIRKKQE
jgi:short-subunit dehydrogenase